MIGLAFAGKSAAGKTTLAELALKELRASGRDALLLSFAGPLCEEVAQLYGLHPDDLDWLVKIRAHANQRRQENPDYWLRAAQAKAKRLAKAQVVPLFDDVRRLREAACLQATGLALVRVNSLATHRTERLLALERDPAWAKSKEPLECELDAHRFQHRINNNTTLAALERHARKLTALC